MHCDFANQIDFSSYFLLENRVFFWSFLKKLCMSNGLKEFTSILDSHPEMKLDLNSCLIWIVSHN